jgi:uncharacterized membrane protein YhhN
MLSKTEQKFTGIYAIIVLFELLCGTFQDLSSLHYFTKPLIIVSLLIFFFSKSKALQKTIRIRTILALVFSLIGDIALLFDSIKPNYFMIGLASFLLAHVMYILVFLKQRNQNQSPLIFMVAMFIYATLLFYFLKDGLGDLIFAVIIYMIVILTMSTTAFLRTKHPNNNSYNWVFSGALIFMISDSILAIDKFYQPLAMSSISIMLTYALAQYCIVLGILKMNKMPR